VRRGVGVRRADRQSAQAEVTGVCSTNVDLVRSLGADTSSITPVDFTGSDQRYDLMLDIAGSRSWSEAGAYSAAGDPRDRWSTEAAVCWDL
jgi:hypothetical protein